MSNKFAEILDRAVRKSTNKSWKEWLKILDQEGALKMEHREIAAMLYNRGYLKNHWWCQMVTVGYEYAHGRRVAGQAKSSGFEVGVQRTFPISQKQAWDLITRPKGRNLWLGKVLRFHLKEGATYKTQEGTLGEIRTIYPFKRIQLTWQPSTWEKLSILQISLECKRNMPQKNPPPLSSRKIKRSLSARKDA